MSREEVLEIFLRLQREGVSILFSTHITSDLDKCADAVTYIRQGRIVQSTDVRTLQSAYVLVRRESMDESLRPHLLGLIEEKRAVTALMHVQDAERLGIKGEIPSLEDIMIHLEKEEACDAAVAL